jgi:hypothetical protein
MGTCRLIGINSTVLAALQDTPIPFILVLAGMTLFFLAIVNELVGRMPMAHKRTRWVVIIGGGLLVIGLALRVFYPLPSDVVAPQLPSMRPPTIPSQAEQEAFPSGELELTIIDDQTISPFLERRYVQERRIGAASPLTVIDRILETLPLANIAFNTPATLRLGHSAVIQLFLSMQHSIEQLQATISAVGEKEGARIHVADQMEARLSGVGFKIETITPEIQAVSERDITEWKWEIEPTRVGSQYLYLTLSVRLYVADNPVPRTVRTFDKIIEVSGVVLPLPQQLFTFAKDNWQWLWAAIVIPIVGWVIGWLRKRRKEKVADWGGPL